MRLGFSLGSVLTIHEIIECVKTLSKNEPDTIWVPETWGMENFSMLSVVSNHTNKAKIGSSIINIYSRSPTLVAMGAATLDTISNKRLVLGLGVSSTPIIENFHGYKFDNNIQRMKEYVEIIKLALSGKPINFEGKIFQLNNFSLLIEPLRNNIPIYLAAVNKKMVNLAWDLADGVIFYLRPIEELKKTIAEMQSKRKIDTTCQIITAISQDVDKAIDRAKQTLAFYISVGKIYREFLAKNGFGKETEVIYNEYRKSGLKENYKLVPESMLEKLTICGTPDDGLRKLRKFQETGLDLPIIQFNPVGNVSESFELLSTTFSGELE